MKKYNVLSKMIVKKTGSFFKFSIILFTTALLIASSAMIFSLSQYLQWNKNFTANNNTHIITINSKMDNGEISSLKFYDEDNIEELISDSFECELYCKYSICTGITDANDKVYYLNALSKKDGILLDVEDYDENTIYCSSDETSNDIVLNIPIIDVKGDGFESSKANSVILKDVKKIGKNAAINLYNNENINNELYLPLDNFKEITEMMFGVSWNELKENYDINNPYNMEIIDCYYVYVNELSDVDKLADALESSGYNIYYTIKAFDNISETVDLNYVLIISMIGIVLIFSAVTMYSAFNSYFKMQQKDMGILRQMGYKNKEIFFIYKKILFFPFVLLFIIIAIYTIVLGSIVFDSVIYSFEILFVLMIIMGIVFGILYYILYNYTKRDIIYLLKASKVIEV